MRICAIALALCLVFTLAACGAGPTLATERPSAPPESSAPVDMPERIYGGTAFSRYKGLPMDWSENGCGFAFGSGPEYTAGLYWADGSTGTLTLPSIDSALYMSCFLSQDVNAAVWFDGGKAYTLCGKGSATEDWREAVIEPAADGARDAIIGFTTSEDGWLAVCGADGGFEVFMTADAGTSWQPLCAVPDGDVTGALFAPDGFGIVGFSAEAGKAPDLRLTRDGGENWSGCSLPMETDAAYSTYALTPRLTSDGGIVTAVLLEAEDAELTRRTAYFRSDDFGESWHRLDVLGQDGYISMEYGGVDTGLPTLRLGTARTTDAQLISDVLGALDICLWEPDEDTYTGESPIYLTFAGDGAPCMIVIGAGRAEIDGKGYAVPDGAYDAVARLLTEYTLETYDPAEFPVQT